MLATQVFAAAALSGLIYHILTPTGWGLWVSLAGFGVGMALSLPAWPAGGGAGEVKLLAALGAWLGTECLLIAFGGTVVLAAAVALIASLRRPKPRHAVAASGPRLRIPRPAGGVGRRRQVRGLPFAVPVAMSTSVVLTRLVAQGGL